MAVALRASPFALGTDTGGSIRQPASFCGLTGLKPTYGRVSRYGVIAFASSLDQVGPMSPDALGCAAQLDMMGVFDGAHDATSKLFSDQGRTLQLTQAFSERSDLSGLTIGWAPEFFQSPALAASVKSALLSLRSDLESRGARFVEVSLPHLEHSLAVYYLICTSEASSNLARYSGIHFGHRASDPMIKNLSDLISSSRSEGFGSEVRRRVLLGTFALSHGFYDAYFQKAAQVRRLIHDDFLRAFEVCDVLLGPTAPTTAFRIGEKSQDPLTMYLSDIFTLAANLAGLPALSFHIGFDDQKLPMGAQLMGPRGCDARLLGLVAHYQRVHPESIVGAWL